MVSGFNMKKDAAYHRQQIRYDQTHYPPGAAAPKITWHRQQIAYDLRRRRR